MAVAGAALAGARAELVLPGTGAMVAEVEFAEEELADPVVRFAALLDTPGLIFAKTSANMAVAATDTATTLRCNLLDLTRATSPLDIPLKLTLAIKNPPRYSSIATIKCILSN